MAPKKGLHNRQHAQKQLVICQEKPTGVLKMYDNNYCLSAGALPQNRMGSLQRSSNPLAGLYPRTPLPLWALWSLELRPFGPRHLTPIFSVLAVSCYCVRLFFFCSICCHFIINNKNNDRLFSFVRL